MSSVKDIQKEAQSLQDRYQKCQEAMLTLNNEIQQHEVAMNENETVKKELEGLKENQKVFKLVGPALIRVDIDDAKSNIDNRLNLIKRQTDELADKAKKESDNYKKLEDEMIKFQQKLAMMKVNNLPQAQ